MADIIHLPDNFIGKDDRERLEAFGGHVIAHGRATRFHWARDGAGDDAFEIYRGGAHEELVLRIQRDRQQDTYYATDPQGETLSRGSLEHVMADLDRRLAQAHGE